MPTAFQDSEEKHANPGTREKKLQKMLRCIFWFHFRTKFGTVIISCGNVCPHEVDDRVD